MGQVVLLDFWATWCTGCKLEIPWFMEFATKYRSKGLTAIGVAVDDEGWQTIKPYLAQHPISYPIVLGDMDVLQKTFGLPASLPVTLLIDKRAGLRRHILVSWTRTLSRKTFSGCLESRRGKSKKGKVKSKKKKGTREKRRSIPRIAHCQPDTPTCTRPAQLTEKRRIMAAGSRTGSD